MTPIIIIIVGELPVTINFNPFDRAPGDHNFTIVANSTLGEIAEFTTTFNVSGTVYIYYEYAFCYNNVIIIFS